MVVDTSDFSLVTWERKSLAQQAGHLAPGSHVIKAFNLSHARVWQMTPPVFGGRPLAVPFGGADEGKAAARRFGDYDPQSVFAFVSPGRTVAAFASR